MLLELAIRDLALIEAASLHFGGGLNAVTGETGAGKSLLIDALELLLGQRPRAGMVRAGAAEARVEGRFLLGAGAYGREVAAWIAAELPDALEEARGEGSEELELILTRTLARDGRTRAHVNHRPVTQRILRELAALLVEIHGQNDHQRLFEPGEQLRLLDTFGAHRDALARYAERRSTWIDLAERLERFETEAAERVQRLDLLRFQAAELAAAAPDEDEARALSAEREVLRHADEIGRNVGSILRELSEEEPSALDAVRRAERVLEEWEERIGALAAPAADLRAAHVHLEEAVAALLRFADGLEVDPARLEEVEARLGELEQLERKYRTDVAGLAARRRSIEAELEGLESEGVEREALAAKVEAARAAVEESARRLARARRRLRAPLKRAVEAALADLGLGLARFDVAIGERSSEAGERRRLGASGADTLEFLLAANPGEEPQPLRRVASGGEMARTMLALRSALAVEQSTPTLIFDEVDTGVGGRLGPKVGRHLRALAGHHQVLCVTHLPAIAALAHRHLRVEKEVRGGRTRTLVRELAGDERVQEIADMIAGGAGEATAQAEARRLLEQA